MERRDAWILGIRGVVAIVFGILAVVWPGVTALVLALLFGVFAIATGINQLVAAMRRAADPGHRAARLVAGVVGVVLGLLAILWPGITILALAVVIGAWAIITGVSDLWLATRELGGWWLALVGAVSIVVGLFILLRPGAGAVAIAWTIGVYAIVAGVLALVGMWQLSHHASGSGRGRPAAAGM